MLQLFHALAQRVKALFITNAALDFEAQFVSRDAERKAELLRQAAQYEKEGLHIIAQELRERAEQISLEQPLATVLPSIEHLHANVLTFPNDAKGPPSETKPAGTPLHVPSARKTKKL
jgi:hypothetical protein